MATQMTYLEFWNSHNVTQIFFAGHACPAGAEINHNVDTDCDEDYCDINDYDDEEFHDLVGTVDHEVWTWDGEGNPTDCYGNSYYKIQLLHENTWSLDTGNGTHGGKRKGAGRPPLEQTKVMISKRVHKEIAEYLRQCDDGTAAIENAVRNSKAFRDWKRKKA